MEWGMQVSWCDSFEIRGLSLVRDHADSGEASLALQQAGASPRTPRLALGDPARLYGTQKTRLRPAPTTSVLRGSSDTDAS